MNTQPGRGPKEPGTGPLAHLEERRANSMPCKNDGKGKLGGSGFNSHTVH